MNPRLTRLEPSVIRALAAKKKPDSIDLGLGEPTLGPQARFLEAATRWAIASGVKYTTNAGDAATRERIAAHYAYPGLSHADNVCMMTGSQEAVYVTIKTMLDPETDELLVVEPAFPAYVKMASLEGIPVRTVEMRAENDFRYDVDAILAAIGPRTRMIVVASPANPTGRVITRDDARRLSDALGKRGGEPIWILQDEIYRELMYRTDAGSIADFYPHTIVANSLSKSNALTGLRVGWVLAPSPAIEQITKTHAWVTSSASAFAQRVAYEIFGAPGALSEQAAWYRTRQREVVDILQASGLRFIEPDGAFYVCVRLRDGIDSIPAAHLLADERGVIAIPGRIFGATLEGWLRLSFVAPPDVFTEGLRRIAAL